jgi:hypothetical protein
MIIRKIHPIEVKASQNLSRLVGRRHFINLKREDFLAPSEEIQVKSPNN